MLATRVKSTIIQIKPKLLALWQKRNLLDSNVGKALILLSCVSLGMIVGIVQTGIPTKGEDADLDSGYIMALASTFQQGYILGRDVYFNYGPLAQLINWLATLFTASHSAFDSFALMIVIYRLVSLVSLAGILMLLPQIRWKYTLVVFLGCFVLNIALESAYYRSLFLVLAAVLLARSLAARNRCHRLIMAACFGLLAFALQMFTFEIGIYAVVSAITVIVILAALSWRQLFRKGDLLPVKDLALTLGTLLGVYLLGNLLLSLVFKLTSASYKNLIDYQLFSLDLVRGYNYTFGVPWSLSNIGTWILALVIIYSVGLVIWYCKKLPVQEAYLLFSLLIFSLFELKSAITRSDLGHLAYACLPVLLLFLILGHDWLQTGGSIKLVWAGLFITLIASWPLANLDSFKTLGQVLDGKISVSAKVKQILEQNTPGDQIVPKGVLTAADPAKAILTFPNEYYYGLGFNKKIVAPIIQAYAAHTLNLQQYYIDTMAQNKANLEILYGLDGVNSLSIDSVPNITRSPLIFDYIYKNFEMKTRELFGKGYMLLKARPERQDMVSSTITFGTEKNNPNLYIYNFNEPAKCSMMRLTPKIEYPITSLIGRPNNLLAEFWWGGKRFQKTGMVTIEPGKPFSTYISLVDPTKFDSLFTNELMQTKPVDSIQIKIQPTGLFGVNPNSVELTKLECITFER